MFDLRGIAATRLFVQRSEDKNCSNVALRRSLVKEVVRKGMQDSGNERTIDQLPRLLPATSKLRDFVTKKINNLFCNCKLCGNDSDEERRRFRRWTTSSKILQSDDNIKGISILILSGCLFTLRILYKEERLGLLSILNGQVGRNEWALPSLFDRFHSSRPDHSSECPHLFKTRDVVFEDDYSVQARQLCENCLQNAFQEAIALWSRILNIPTLEKTGGVENRINQNLPYISQALIVPEQPRRRINTSFYSSKIEPGYCRLRGLEDRELFRKVYKYKPHERDQINRATKEAEIGLKLSEKTHPHIVHTLFALQRDDGDFIYIELVFPRYKEDLESILSQSRQRTQLPPRDQADPLDDPLWKAMIKVFEALAVMHEGIATNQLACSGHFDIRPSNVLREKPEDAHGDGFGNLLLADFGQAAANRAGADDYAPPEKVSRRSEPQSYLRPTYDIWSMACVLIQVLVFLTQGSDELKAFDTARHDETNAAFWQCDENGIVTLRREVVERLNHLGSEYGLGVQSVVATLRAMLSIEPNRRPTTTSCLAQLKCRGYQELIECDLDRWKTFYSFRPNIQSPARLYLYRDQYHRVRTGDVEEEATLDIQGVSCETVRIPSVSLVPLAFYDPETSFHDIFACRFDNLHKGITFRFAHLDEFLNFIELLTYQRIVPVLPNDPLSGIDIGFSACSLKKTGFFDTKVHYGRGRLQVWNQLQQNEYNNRYRGSFSSSSVRTGMYATHKENVWKLALWTTNKQGERVCIIVDIGSRVWKEERSPKSVKRLILKQLPGLNFRGGVLEPSKQEIEEYASKERYPGFPISPNLLLTKLRIQLKSIEIEFFGTEDWEKFLNILRRNNFPILL